MYNVAIYSFFGTSNCLCNFGIIDKVYEPSKGSPINCNRLSLLQHMFGATCVCVCLCDGGEMDVHAKQMVRKEQNTSKSCY